MARHDARHVLGFVDIAEIATHVVGVDALLVETACVEELHLWELARQFQNIGVKVAEGGGKQHLGSIDFNHAPHGLGHGGGFGHAGLFYQSNSRHIGHHGSGPFGVGLVIAKVILGANVEEAHHQFFARSGSATRFPSAGGLGAACTKLSRETKGRGGQQPPHHLTTGKN